MASSEPMTLREHLDELRKRLFFSLVFVLIASVAAFVFRDQIFAFLLKPGFPLGEKPVYIDVTEMVGVTFKVTLMAGFVIALPVVLHQVIMFVSPGLTGRERLYLYIMLPGVFLSFVAGVAFGYYVIFPPAFNFLLHFGTNVAQGMIRISSYINFVTTLMFWMGTLFEIPIVMFGLARLGVVSPQRLARFRRYAIVIAFVVGAIITPPDALSQALAAMPIVLLYELGILLARFGAWLRRPALQEAPAAE